LRKILQKKRKKIKNEVAITEGVNRQKQGKSI
jgi:hypothetical protein